MLLVQKEMAALGQVTPGLFAPSRLRTAQLILLHCYQFSLYTDSQIGIKPTWCSQLDLPQRMKQQWPGQLDCSRREMPKTDSEVDKVILLQMRCTDPHGKAEKENLISIREFDEARPKNISKSPGDRLIDDLRGLRFDLSSQSLRATSVTSVMPSIPSASNVDVLIIGAGTVYCRKLKRHENV